MLKDRLQHNHVSALRRSGAALVEMGIVCSLFFMLIFGMIECSTLFMVTQAMMSAAREGARFAIIPRTDPIKAPKDSRVEQRVLQRLESAGIDIRRMNPSVTNTARKLKNDPITVTVKLNYRLLSGVSWFKSGGDVDLEIPLERSVVMQSES